jgi:hypothetical protein
VALWRQQRSLSATVELAAGESRDLAWAGLVPAEPVDFALAKGAGPAQGEPELKQAIRSFEGFQDEKASVALRALLARHPPANVAGKAHLYLGLILFNAVHSDEAREEFKQAMLADPAVELPINMSPKAQLAFGEARRDLAREVEASPGSAHAAVPAEASATSLEVSTQGGPSRSHWLSWTLGGVGVAAGAVAIYGGVEVLTYTSAVNNAKTGSPTTASSLSSTNAGFWRAGWIVAAAVGAAGLTSAVLVW